MKTHEFSKEDARAIAFQVGMPKDREITVRYRVR
jgi:hypothetical protein